MAIGVAVVVVITGAGVLLSRPPVATADTTGTVTYPDLARGHVSTPVVYAQVPPAGGDHAEEWQNCGVYTAPVQSENAVHSLEHGAIWVTYRPDLAPDQVQVLQAAVKTQPYGLLSPFPGLPAPVVATVWGVQLKVQSATDPQLASFIAKYADASQAPEPRGECTGGIGAPTDR
ncbi:DUF3105 domain-containing protein [Propionicimonas paludicola]|uniref:DUF3105 domain-containing protein n=1 Tax=Propionicimonas paludicola TaxID=185243 RepID=UPI001474B863|nr:DUF3105 domain-containing protein [Propionicimonas paludicola]